MNPLFLIDFYKVGHVDQYLKGTEQIWVNWTPRSSRVPDTKTVVFFGLQYFIKEILEYEFRRNFFNIPWLILEKEYKEVIRATLGVENPRTDHLEALHKLGYLPLEIYALPEGINTPIGVPMFVMTNTHTDFFWLPNYLETILSNTLWQACTSATTAQRYRKLFLEYARKAGETDFSFVDWMGHDFSFRGMSGREAAILSGMGHLLSFSGTDTLPAIIAANEYYDASLNCGGSVPATEHSVMCAGGQDGEFETFRHLIEDVYPTGVVSIVSDTWDLWKVLTDYIPRLRESIWNRNGKVVIRPDSGDPIKILTGGGGLVGSPEFEGALHLLAKALDTHPNPSGRYLINNAGLIYGDSINVERADKILHRALCQGFSPYNFVFGIGSYTYQYVTRDTYNFAMKATAVRRNGKVEAVFKDPVTDNAHKKSHRGIPIPYDTPNGLEITETTHPELLGQCAFRTVFSNGRLLIDQDFSIIRQRVREGL